ALNYELKLELPKEIKRARELGDLRENAEYAAAKERQRLVESRISMLQKRVSEIALINVDRIPKDRAGFGSIVHVVEGNGEKLVFQLVMPEDADAAKGLVSTTSPIGRAFLNKEPGDAGVLRALHEAGVKIDVAAGRGVGVVGALFAAVDGAQRLWDGKGFWRAAVVRSFYGWHPVPRLLAWALAASLAIVAIPLAVM